MNLTDLCSKNNKSGLIFTFMMLIYLILSTIGSVIILLFKIGEYGVYISVFFPTIAFIMTYIVFNDKRKKVSEKLYIKKFNILYLIIVLFISFSMLFYVGKINALFVDLLNRLGIETNETVIPLNNTIEYVVSIITMAIIPAVSEELFFRGMLFNSLKKHGVIFAIVISSLCFALYHCSFSQLIYQFIYGLIFALLFYVSDSVIPGIICHFINNTTIITLEYFNIQVEFQSVIIKIIGIVCLCISLFVLVFAFVKREKDKKEYNRIDFFIPFGTIGITFCVLVSILSVVKL